MRPSATPIPLVLALLPGSAIGQTGWTHREVFGRVTAPVAFDVLRNRLVVLTNPPGSFGGPMETWEWDGTTWQAQRPATTPSARVGHAMVYDVRRARVVCFGGSTTVAETWEWDGIDWTNRQPAVSPPVRQNHAMAYDLVADRTILFGGERSALTTVYLGDTWTWDGTQWSQIPAAGPAARSGHGLAFDLVANRTVLFGGQNAAGFVQDTWTFDGLQWQARVSAQQPPSRSRHGMVQDLARSRTIVFGGQGQGARLDDTWQWDGNTWSQVPSTVAPSTRSNCTMAYDSHRGASVLFSGDQDFAVHGDLWQWNGTVWSRLAASQAPPARHSHAAAFDRQRGRLVVFGGVGNNSSLGDHWEWDGSRWTEVTALPSPPGRAAASMVFDHGRGRTILFGGTLQGASNDLWEWDGGTWVRPPTPTAPAPRSNHAMVFDGDRGRAVLFGGVGAVGQGLFNDTWEWDGLVWRLASPANRPTIRAEHVMAYDSMRRRTVVYGGYAPPFTLHLDTWEWDGTNWALRNTTGAPGARRDGAMTFEAARARVVLFAGVNSIVSDTWEWDGTNWLLRIPVGTPPARIRHTLDYDPVTDRVLLFGGQSAGPNFSDVWEYRPLVPATFTTFGVGCAGSAGVPSLAAAAGTRPWLGTAFTMQLRSLAPNSIALAWFGFSRIAWGTLTLPLDLGFLQMPGCQLATGIDQQLAFLSATSGVADVTIQIPQDPALLAWTVHCQGAATDAAANAFGLVVTNAATLQLGGL